MALLLLLRVVSAPRETVFINMVAPVAGPETRLPASWTLLGTVVLEAASNPLVKVVVTPAAPIVVVPVLRNVTRFAIVPPPLISIPYPRA